MMNFLPLTDSVPLAHIVGLGVAVFAAGAFGFLVRRNLIVLLMCVELMLNGANIVLVAFSRAHASPDPQVWVMFMFAVAAAEAGVGLALAVLIWRRLGTLDIDALKGLRG